MDTNNDGGKQPKKWRKLSGKINPIKMYSKIMKSLSTFRTKFQSLSKKGKLIFSLQLMTLMIIFGAGSSQIFLSNVRSNPVGSVRTVKSKPVEVPYSVFMDMVEKSGKVRLMHVQYFI